MEINMIGTKIKASMTVKLIPVYLTANSVKTNNAKLYTNILKLFVYFFFVLIRSNEQIKDKTGI